MLFCIECGRELIKEFEFCPECGTFISRIEQETPIFILITNR